jgi:ABC-type sugar transport system ATPase subunit/ribose/xylose/arabinose/galactoside ABC-type transport system permease subunit
MTLLEAPVAPTAPGTVVMELRGVSKSFDSTRAVRDVSVTLRAGEVLALLGENGAGKSTCVKMIAGVYAPDTGSIVIDGADVRFASPLDAQRAGIAVVHQHPAIFPDLSVAENIYAGQMEHGTAGILDLDAMRRGAHELLELLGLDADPDQRAGLLRTGEQQLIEIARALAAKARVLIMDEPTAALSNHEVELLFRVVETLRSRGVTMMFVGHRLEEVFAIADRITVLRDGALVDTRPVAELTPARTVQLMVGREVDQLYPERVGDVGAEVLSVDRLTRFGEYENITFSLRAGEVLGLGGLVGAGRTEIARTLFGITKPDSGTIRIDGEEHAFSSPQSAMENGIAYVSEDRRGQSLVMDFSILDNASLPVLGRTTRAGITSRSRELDLVREPLRAMRLRFASYQQPVSTLSGGNQQKVVLAKWLGTNPRILILDEPTQGIDVQAKAEVHRLIAGFAADGMAVVLISSDMPELIAMSDRVLVLREGRQTAVIDRADVSPEAIGAAATGASLDVDDDGYALELERIDAAAGSQPVTHAEPLDAAPEPVASAGGGRPTGSATSPSAASPDRGGASGLFRRLGAARELGLIAVILAIAVPVSLLNPRFLDSSNLTSVAVDASLLLFVAAGQLLVMLTGNIDVSVSSTVGLAAYVSAMSMRDIPDLPVAVGVVIAIAIGLACGTVNALVIAYGRVPSIVATLGTLAVFRGVTSLVANSRQVSASDVPAAWLDFASAKVGPVPLLVLIALALLIVLAQILKRTAFGREFYLVGSNAESAELIGVKSKRRIFSAYVICGGLSGFAGALWASHFATVDSRVASGIELSVIASVIVGGAALAGGVGTVTGVALGTVVLLLIRNGLSLTKVDPLWLQAAYGVVILGAVVLNLVLSRTQTRRRKGSR